MVPGQTFVSKLCVFKWSRAHLCINTLCSYMVIGWTCASTPCVCFYLVIGHICALTPYVSLLSLGTSVPPHVVFIYGPWMHLCLNTLCFYMVMGHIRPPPVAIQTSRIGARTVPSSSSDVPAKGDGPPQYRVRREVGCVVRASFRASRFGLRRCF